MDTRYEDTQAITKMLFNQLLALDHDIVDIWFRAEYFNGNMKMFRCMCKAEVKEYAHDEEFEDGEEPLEEFNTYTEYTIIGETFDPNYPQCFTFIDGMIVSAKVSVNADTGADEAPLNYHLGIMSSVNEEPHQIMICFPGKSMRYIDLQDLLDEAGR